MNYKIVLYIATILVSLLIGYNLHKFKHVDNFVTTDVTPTVSTVSSNVQLPKYRTEYVTKTVTVNVDNSDGENIVYQYIVISENNAVTLAEKFQEDLIQFENKPLQITISPYEIINGIPPASVTMDAKLHYRTWSLLISNNYTVKTKKVVEEIKGDDWSVNGNYNLKSGKFNAGVYKQIFRLLGIPLYLGLETELN